MPNQLNYADKIKTTDFQRPNRISKKDAQLVISGSDQILYGTRDKDNVEIWTYNPDGTYAGHVLFRPVDKELSLTTVIDQSGPHELLNVDMKEAALQMNLSPGRYAVAMNFFRDEVGSEDGYKLYITQISKDRMEVKLHPLEVTDAKLLEIYEFIVPSVPKRFAQAVIDQMFGASLDAETDEQINNSNTLDTLESLQTGTISRIQNSDSSNAFQMMISTIKTRLRTAVLNQMAADTTNYAVQEIEILGYIQKSIQDIIYDMNIKGEIDPRFTVN